MSVDDTEPSTAPILAYAPEELPGDRRRGSGLLAVALSLILPGLGHGYNGLTRRGAMWLAVSAALWIAGMAVLAVPALVPALLPLMPMTAAVIIWILIDAWRTAGRSPGRLPPAARIILSVVLVLAAVFAHPVDLALTPLYRLYRKHVAEAFVVPSSSMVPTIREGDRFICHKRWTWGRWSIVVFDAPMQPGSKYVMRIVGLPGEIIHIADGQVHVNGEPLDSPGGIGPYLSPASLLGPIAEANADEPVTLGPDEYYLLGDNTAVAADSRFHGPIRGTSVHGPATWIYWPPWRWARLSAE